MKPIKFKENRVRRTYRGGKMIDLWRSAAVCADCGRPEEWIASAVLAVNRGKAPIDDEGLSRTEDGALLRDLISENPEKMLGTAHTAHFGAEMGLLVKALDACERLSIQVHPDKEAARRLFRSDYGKTEAWYILGGREINGNPPCIYAGFLPGVTAKRWKELFDRQDVQGMLDCLEKIPVHPGQVYLLRGGVPHAIGAGCFIIEIQEPTDYTIRTERTTASGEAIPDFLCHQGLGFERMFDCFHYGDGEPACRLSPHRPLQSGGAVVTPLVTYGDTTAFSMEEWQVDGRAMMACNGTFYLLICVSGGGRLLLDDGWDMPLRQGEYVFVPADCGAIHLCSEGFKLLRCLPPCRGGVNG